MLVFSFPHCGSSRLFRIPEFASHVYVRTNDQLINQSDQRIPLCSLSSWSLFHLLRHSMLSLCSYFWGIRLVSLHSILLFEMALNPNHCHCLVWVIPVFSFHSIRFDKEWISRNGLQVKIPSPWNILCSRTGHTYIYLQPDRNGCRIEPLLCSRTGHTYIYLQPYRNGCRIEPLLCSRTGHTYIYLQPDRNGCRIELLLCSRTGHIYIYLHQMEMVVEWNPYGRISHNMSLVPTHVTKYWLHSPDFIMIKRHPIIRICCLYMNIMFGVSWNRVNKTTQ